MWTSAFTGMRRGELLGLKWIDLDTRDAAVSINRALHDIDYNVVETPDITPHIGASRGKTRNARRRIDLDPTTMNVLSAWRTWQTTERAAAGLEPTEWMFTDVHGDAIHPQVISQTFDRMLRRAPVPNDDIAPLELFQRQRAPAENVIRDTKACGLANLPFDCAVNIEVWMQLCFTAHDLLVWAQQISLTGAMRQATPKTLRHRLLQVAARVTPGGRRLDLDRTWPWTATLLAAVSSSTTSGTTSSSTVTTGRPTQPAYERSRLACGHVGGDALRRQRHERGAR